MRTGPVSTFSDEAEESHDKKGRQGRHGRAETPVPQLDTARCGDAAKMEYPSPAGEPDEAAEASAVFPIPRECLQPFTPCRPHFVCLDVVPQHRPIGLRLVLGVEALAANQGLVDKVHPSVLVVRGISLRCLARHCNQPQRPGCRLAVVRALACETVDQGKTAHAGA